MERLRTDIPVIAAAASQERYCPPGAGRFSPEVRGMRRQGAWGSRGIRGARRGVLLLVAMALTGASLTTVTAGAASVAGGGAPGRGAGRPSPPPLPSRPPTCAPPHTPRA